MPLDQTTLKQWVHYDSETGIFVRLKAGRRCHDRLIGAPVGSNRHGYRAARLFGRTYALHQLAWLYMTGEWPSRSIDHINRNRADNRWSNLRLAARTQQNANMSPRSDGISPSGVRGVYALSSGRWRARIYHNGHPLHLGVFDTIDEAKAAWLAAAHEQWGEFVHCWDFREQPAS